MDIWETDKIVLFLGFVIPGFVSMKVYELIFLSAPKDSSSQLIDAIAYSSINYAILILPIYAVESNNIRESFPYLYATFYAAVIFVSPVVLVFSLKALRKIDFIKKVLPHPTARPWDFVFEQRRQLWIIITCKDGKKIGGKYSFLSFASSSPAPEQLYLEEAWVINNDGGFERPRKDSAGIIIMGTEIVDVELFNMKDGEPNGGEEESHAQ